MKRDSISLSLELGNELIVDNFAGGGGASTGIERAFGRPIDIAINHDGEALAMHAANHPSTKHYTEDVFAVHPGFITGEQPIGLAWFSPDCKHHSKAKGGKPREQKIRGLAWVALKWATFQVPRCIALENVEEFQDWGPLDDEGRPIKAEKGRTFRAFIAALTTGLPKDHPDTAEIYETLGADFPMERLHAGLGYKAEWRVLRACDYGTPTIRKRLYVFARRDGLPIVWPTVTHGDPKSDAVKSGKLLPWRTAAECIDWSAPCPSIFERARPLKDATLRRIAKGIMKFVVNAADPFIVTYYGDKAGEFRGSAVDEPLRTQSTENRFAIVEPYLVRTAHSDESPTGVKRWGVGEHPGSEPVPTVTASQDFAIVAPTLMHVTHQGADRNANVDAPIATVTGANRGEQALITAHISKMRTGSIGSALGEPLHTVTAGGEQARPGTGNAMGIVAATLVKQNFGDTPCQDAGAPLHTITTQGNKFGLVSATLIQTGYGEREGQEPRVPRLEKPLGTAVAGGVKHALVTAFLAQHNKERNGGVKAGRSADGPISTITSSGGQQQIVSALLAKHYGGNETPGSDLGAPMGTITSQDHHALVTAHLQRDFGKSVGGGADAPIGTVTAGGGGHQALVTSSIVKMRGTNIGHAVNEPLHTISAGGQHHGEVRALLQKYHGPDALGTVTINGELFAIVDIGMRMLAPRELARAQGFPDSYVLDPMIERNRETGEIRLAQAVPTSESASNPRMVRTRKGKNSKPLWVKAPLSKSAQVRMIGNSVCPDVATALINANFAHERQIVAA